MPTLKNPKADLRNFYNRTLKLSLIISIAIIIAAFKYSPNPSLLESIDTSTPEIIKIEDIISTIQKPEVPPPPKAPQIIEATIENVPDDIILSDVDDYTPDALPDIPPISTKIVLADEPFIEYPEELPEPRGGMKTLQEKVHYTEIGRRAGIEGTVLILASINKNGDVVDAKVRIGIGAGLDEEALNAVLTTKFVPGKQRGMPVNVKMTIPIKFVLK